MTELNRRNFIKALSAGGALAAGLGRGRAAADEKPAAPKDPAAPGTLPLGKLGKLQVSRMLLGGNLLTCYTHARDLRFVYKLIKRYNTDEKILETLALAEQHGINTLAINISAGPMKVFERHRKQGGKMQYIIHPTAKVAPDMGDYETELKQLADFGVEMTYLWGVWADQLLAEGKIGLIAKAVEAAKKHNMLSGVGAHDLGVVQECEKNGIPVDFYVKTFHNLKYDSAPRPDEVKGPTRETPGYWCKDANAVTEVMKKVEKPWIAFKVMAAGTIKPQDAFKYAFENGADHILVGMFDFDVAEDAKIVRDTLADLKRERPWRT